MDKAILKKFAIESRQDLMQKIESKIKLFYVDEAFSKQQNGDIYVLVNDKHTLSLSKEEYEKRELLVKRINELGLEQVIEEAAYTWFNRIVAIRYMEINDYLPLTKDNQSLGIRVLSSKDNTPDPEIMKFTNLTNPDLDIDFKKEKYIELKDDNEKYKYVLLLVCKKLGKVIPQVFDGITDYIDLLIPDNLLNDSGFINKIINEVPSDNYNQVEIIGWLYQYYNQLEKDRVIGAKKTYKKNEIAYATQLFTPDWIVKYMVENSLGKYWIEHGGNKQLINNWSYFIEDNLKINESNLDPKNIKCIDPCMGSGHILVYMFDILYQIYESYGYSKTDISKNILKYNLFGLDIDDRAGQLSILSVILKAREYDKYIFNDSIVKQLNIMSLQESKEVSGEIYDNNLLLESDIDYLIKTFKYAKEIGSLLITEKNDYSETLNKLENNIFDNMLAEELKPLIKQANILSEKYDVVVTNPPYMNNSVMSKNIKDYLSTHYKEAKSDLFSSFILRNLYMTKEKGNLGFMTPYVWMFISSYEELRKLIITKSNITSLIQLEYSALDEATVPICTFTLKNDLSDTIGYYYRLSDYVGGMEVQKKEFLNCLKNKQNLYIINNKDFEQIPGYVIGYWITKSMIKNFAETTFSDKYDLCVGLQTGNNNKFLRFWWEIAENKNKWFPYNKGGEYRRWYGNREYVVNWENDGYDIKHNYGENGKLSSRPQNTSFYFKKSVSWSDVSTGKINGRFFSEEFMFDTCAPSLFSTNLEDLIYSLAYLNSKVCQKYMDFLSPTLHYTAGALGKNPYIRAADYDKEIIDLVKENLEISKNDWNSFETSNDFMLHPLLKNKNGGNIIDSFAIWEKNCTMNFNHLKENEEKLNKIFIDAYGLTDELKPEVDEKDITIRKADRVREVKSLINYAVGCMFGRYSLDKEGLVFAGGEFNESNYKTFKVDTDNIILITDEAYFSDDIVARFKDFIEVVYGKESLNANLDFIAETLGKKGTETSEETIRRYFLNDFYSDHIKMYQKKPIYWLFDSGKKNGFKALIYMHRYNENTVPKVRLDYLHRIQNTYDKLLTDVNYKLTTELSVSDKKIAQNRQAVLNAKLQEMTAYDEKIAHIANQRISIDLDDGVTTNYSKFADILAKIK